MSKCKDMEKLSKVIVKEGFPETDHAALVTLLLNIFEEDFDKKLFPRLAIRSELENLKDSLKFPIFVLLQDLFRERNSDNRNRTMDILQEIEKSNSKLRYHIIYFLCVTLYIANAEDSKPKSQFTMKLYEDYIAKSDLEMNDALFEDLRCCIYDDSHMFFFILPRIYKFLEDAVIYNGPKLIELMIFFGEEAHVYDLITKIMRNDIRILDEQDLPELFGMLLRCTVGFCLLTVFPICHYRKNSSILLQPPESSVPNYPCTWHQNKGIYYSTWKIRNTP